jgi:hypothetical protein
MTSRESDGVQQQSSAPGRGAALSIVIVYARPVVIDLERGSQAHAVDGEMSRASFPLAALCETAPPGGYWAELSVTCELGRPMCVICMGRLVTRLGSMDAALHHREQGESVEQRLRVVNASRLVELDELQFEEDIEALLATPDAAQLDGDGVTTSPGAAHRAPAGVAQADRVRHRRADRSGAPGLAGRPGPRWALHAGQLGCPDAYQAGLSIVQWRSGGGAGRG